MAPYLAALLDVNGLTGSAFAEPFAGGAGASVALLYAGKVSRLIINDADPAISTFWLALLSNPGAFIQKVYDTPITIEEWHNQREIWKNPEEKDPLTRGFATFFLNRTNRSGILRGCPIGGLNQTGNYPITARYNPQQLAKRLTRLVKWCSRISVSSLDALDFLEAVAPRAPFLFLDPPYVDQGKNLYMNAYTHEHHEKLANWLKAHKSIPWVLTYDDHPLIRDLYSGWASVSSVSLRYSAQVKRQATELLILPPGLQTPNSPIKPLRYLPHRS